MGDKYSKEDAYQTIELINSWINNVDTKTSFALAYVAVLMGFAFAHGTPAVFKELMNTCPPTKEIIIKLILVLALYITSILAVTNLFMAIIARVKNDSGKKSMLFFGTIICSLKIKKYNQGIIFLIIATVICFVSVAFGIV